MIRLLRSGCGLLMAGAMMLAGCGKQSEAQPPRVYLGQTSCAECGMIVSDERYVAAMLISQPDGEPGERVFDDIGCFVKYQKVHTEQGGETVQASFVKDFATKQWLPAERAWFVYGTKVPSPMEYGLLATRDGPVAGQLAGRYDGKVLDYPALRQLAPGSAATATQPASPPSGR